MKHLLLALGGVPLVRPEKIVQDAITTKYPSSMISRVLSFILKGEGSTKYLLIPMIMVFVMLVMS